jgi:hypothetical protein
MPEQRDAGERLQNLGEIGLHSLALTGSEDNDGEFHEAASLAAREQVRESAAELPAGCVVGIVTAGIVGGEIVFA